MGQVPPRRGRRHHGRCTPDSGPLCCNAEVGRIGPESADLAALHKSPASGQQQTRRLLESKRQDGLVIAGEAGRLRGVPFDLDERFVIAAEQKLGASLPYSYRQAMMASNGGEVVAYDDVWNLYPILDTSDRKRLKRSCNDILHETKCMCGWPGWPENALAIASNGTSDRLALLKVNRRYEPTIYAWLHDTGELMAVAEVFSDLERP